MTRLANVAAQLGEGRAASMLSLLAVIAAETAKADRIDNALPRVLEQIRLAFGAAECTLWCPSSSGMPAVWRAGGEAGNGVAPVMLDLEGEGGGTATATVRFGSRDVGVLSLRLGRQLEPVERVTLRSAADMLAPLLASAPSTAVTPTSLESMTEADRRFSRKIVDSLPIGLYVIDREYRIQAWNRKRETGMQGVSREEALGRTVFEILHRQSAATLRAEFDEVFSTGRITQNEIETLAGGEQRTYRMSKIPMRLEDGAVTHVITIGEDVTESRRAQERLAQSEKLAAIGQLAAGVMHEINNPLATIGACVAAIQGKLEDGDATRSALDEYLDIIDREVERCSKIVDGLLDFSRPKGQSKTPLAVPALVDETLFLLKHHQRFKRVAVDRDLAPELPRIQGNREQLIQALMALLLNAVDAMDQTGRLTVRASPVPRRAEVVLAVEDTGVGIPREDQAKIFEPFYTTKQPGRGTGLGLSICYGIVEDHRGRIEVESVPGRGSTFRVYLPAVG